LKGEVERLERAEHQLEQEIALLGRDRRKWEEENEELKRKSLEDRDEIKRLQERYRDVMDEKVALAEELAVSFLKAVRTCY
jgi:DNA repair exonuclease SbcCD ATPase subunit